MVKIRESGMPEEQKWEGFFSPETVLRKLGLDASCGDVLDFGCGYGTFTVPAARLTKGTVYAIDIEARMLDCTARKAAAEGLSNVQIIQRDFVAGGTGLADGAVGYAMLFNILHAEEPCRLLQEAFRVLRPAGRLAVIHWRYDPNTPRGPSMEIRPCPENCVEWGKQQGFWLQPPGVIDLPPYHYGMVLLRSEHD